MPGMDLLANLKGWDQPSDLEFNGLVPDRIAANLRISGNTAALYGAFESDGEKHDFLVTHTLWGAAPPSVKIDGQQAIDLDVDYGYSVHGGRMVHANYTLTGTLFGLYGTSTISVRFLVDMQS